jgi:hypothetical protein
MSLAFLAAFILAVLALPRTHQQAVHAVASARSRARNRRLSFRRRDRR